jgi:metallo-beta-lactamase family protein
LRIGFLGAADTVTGSRHLVQIGGASLLLDCGLFQGFKVYRERNWEPMPPALLRIDAVVLSHAHLDHSGALPLLVRQGFRGPVYASPATCELTRVLLLDAAHLQEEDARRANRYHYSRHPKALPLYTRADAERALARFVPLAPHRPLEIAGVRVELTPVGHLLGACAVSVSRRGERVVYSGDLGRDHDLLMPSPERVSRADVMLIEATYGNREHPAEDPAERLAGIIVRTVERGGSVLVPAFAVGRAQAVLLVLQRLRAAGRVPQRLPIFVDSPMATEATALYRRHAALLRPPRREIDSLTGGVRLVGTAAESMRLARSPYPSVIISASGMATGGRVLQHLKALAPDPRHHVVFAGFQVAGSRGAALIAGAREVKIHGQYVPVRAEVSHLEGFSAHAGRGELLAWLRALRTPPRQTFVVHGEPEASDALRVRIQDDLGWNVRVPQHGQTVEL